MDAKKLRILFIDDESLDVIEVFKKEGYDVEHWRDIESLERLTDGRYQIVFLDVRGVGARYGGNGLDILKYIAQHNALIFTIIFSAKPFNAAESELIRKYAQSSITKDVTFYELTECLDQYAKSLTPALVIKRLQETAPVDWWTRFKLRRRWTILASDVERMAKASGITKDAVVIARNGVTIAAVLIKLASGA